MVCSERFSAMGLLENAEAPTMNTRMPAFFEKLPETVAVDKSREERRKREAGFWVESDYL
jgi:hypothetical protein